MAELFDFSYFPILETERLRLRAITHDDAQAMVDLFAHPDVQAYIILEPPCGTLDEAVAFIDWMNGHALGKGALRWGITLKGGDDTLIGTIGFHFWSREHRRADIGYDVNRAYWGRGYATEATHTLLRWCFDHLDLHRIQADCTAGNLGSERVLEKVGFTCEGLWRESCFEHGRFVDLKQYGLLKREYVGEG
ncbi:MAG: GNAT family N-acetyltransferase [Anaerolineae bacterium]|nr:GNAT family N-acetyltransferase [Anaerolineae bacterium]